MPWGGEGRFFEEAFEWEEMTWITYPYFWGRKSEWTELISFDDPDPVFDDFLKADIVVQLCRRERILRAPSISV
jgi:hypothetical protein